MITSVPLVQKSVAGRDSSCMVTVYRHAALLVLLILGKNGMHRLCGIQLCPMQKATFKTRGRSAKLENKAHCCVMLRVAMWVEGAACLLA